MTQSIDSLKEKIYNHKTKEYFKEVFQSFVNGNNRSAVVFLYSVLLYDLYAKLEELSSVHNDKKAKETLEKVNQIQEDNPTSSEWENVLINRIDEQTELFEKGEKTDIEHLKKKRNLSAHPTIHTLTLYNPDSHTVQALMYNVLQSVLIKPPYFTKDVFENLIHDLKTREDSDVPISKQELKSLIKNRYIKHLSKEKQELIFTNLWKFVFNLINDDTNNNRDINFKALSVFYNECSLDIEQVVRGKQGKFRVKKPLLSVLIKFIAEHPEVFNVLEETTQVEIKDHVETNIEARIYAFFLHDSFDNHIKDLREYFTSISDIKVGLAEGINNLKVFAEESNALNQYFEFIIYLYYKSHSFDEANTKFDLLLDFLDEFNEEQLKDLLTKANENTQCYGRGRGPRDHSFVIKKVKEFDENYKSPSNLV
ncbi:hypothetical protein [Oceanobacillus locisalsi]|uniref:DUF262 domain-containing protein n=1 Tax=Oceanobacillus locisalsi TaxID=546107 RepID=A0ABW3NKQ1_9BACI